MFPKIRELIQLYTMDGTADANAVRTFMDCENEDTIRSLRNELTGIAAGNFMDENLLGTLGIQRKTKHGSYTEWAKRMLVWMAEYRK
jgi:hypothetical protein